MAETNDKSMAIADVYAEALLETAWAQGEQEQVAEELADLVRFMDREPDFDAFLTAASVDDDPRRVSLEKLFRGRMNDLLLNVLQVLNNRFRSPLIRSVARCVQLRLAAQHHQQEVTVQTATPLTEPLRLQLRKEIGERIGKEPLLIEEVCPELIGGMVIRFGDAQVDASVASRLRFMKDRLRERATEEIGHGRGYLRET